MRRNEEKSELLLVLSTDRRDNGHELKPIYLKREETCGCSNTGTGCPERSGGVLIIGDIYNLTGHSPGQLALLCAEGLA